MVEFENLELGKLARAQAFGVVDSPSVMGLIS